MKAARYIDIKVFNEGHKTARHFRLDAGKGLGYTESGAKVAVSNFVKELQARVPHIPLKIVPLAFNKFNIVHEVGNA